MVGLTDSSQSSVAEYSYDAYGNLMSSNGAQANNNLYRYSTKEYFGSIELYNYGYRFYSPGLGRWINRDPLGEAGGLNVYGFGPNSPINGYDPYGMDWVNDTSNFFAGWGDSLTFGGTDWIRGQMGTNSVVDYNSGAYGGGQIVGVANGFAIDAAGIAAVRAAQAAKAAQSARIANEAHNAANYARYLEHMRQLERYGQAGHKTLQSGRIRYYGPLQAAKKAGEMAGRRTVREWCPSSGAKRTWMETVDHSGKVRQVRPETGGPKVHYRFSPDGKYIGKW